MVPVYIIFSASACPIDGAGYIMFSGCPSVCACVLACVPRLRHSPTGLPSNSSYFLLIVGGWNLQKYERNAEMTAMALHFIIPPHYFGIVRSVRLSVPWRSCLGYRHAGCLQHSHRRPPEMCGLRTRPWTDVHVNPPRFLIHGLTRMA